MCVHLFMPHCLFDWVANCLGVGRPLLLLSNRHPATLLPCCPPRRFSLPFAVHLPVHLLCLWIVTAGATLAHVRSGGCSTPAACPATASITAVIASQLIIGFLLASWLAYTREASRRRRFLHTSHRAASFLRRQALPPPPPAPAHEAALLRKPTPA